MCVETHITFFHRDAVEEMHEQLMGVLLRRICIVGHLERQLPEERFWVVRPPELVRGDGADFGRRGAAARRAQARATSHCSARNGAVAHGRLASLRRRRRAVGRSSLRCLERVV